MFANTYVDTLRYAISSWCDLLYTDPLVFNHFHMTMRVFPNNSHISVCFPLHLQLSIKTNKHQRVYYQTKELWIVSIKIPANQPVFFSIAQFEERYATLEHPHQTTNHHSHRTRLRYALRRGAPLKPEQCLGFWRYDRSRSSHNLCWFHTPNLRWFLCDEKEAWVS